jgi:inhibitor of Bruton tyrosine kinase
MSDAVVFFSFFFRGRKVWMQPTPEPAVSPTLPASVMSFVAIQYSQQEQLLASPARDKRSLREIQEEEQALEAEANFLKWWTAEEERVQEEAALVHAQFQSGKPNTGNKQSRKPKHNNRDKEKGQRKSDVMELEFGKQSESVVRKHS